jgi:HAD superfamily hydrolase (TIGR01509 family)
MKFDSEAILAGRSLLLLDFDGPVCSVFAGYPASQIAAELITELQGTAPRLADALKGEQDPMEVLRAAAGSLPQDQIEQVDTQLTHAELAAVESAEPTAGMVNLISAARQAGLAVAIVSNNSASPIEKYLDKHGLADDISIVIGRPFGRPKQMKPDPHLLHEALKASRADASTAVFIGDSVTDVESGKAAGVMTVGFANKPGKAQKLREAGAKVVVDSF